MRNLLPSPASGEGGGLLSDQCLLALCRLGSTQVSGVLGDRPEDEGDSDDLEKPHDAVLGPRVVVGPVRDVVAEHQREGNHYDPQSPTPPGLLSRPRIAVRHRFGPPAHLWAYPKVAYSIPFFRIFFIWKWEMIRVKNYRARYYVREVLGNCENIF